MQARKLAGIGSLCLALAAAAFADAPAGGGAAPPAQPAVDPKAGSYDLGLMFGTQLRNGGVGEAVSLDDLDRGLRAGLAGTIPSDADKAAATQMLRSARATLTEANRAKAREFLASNSKAEGVVTTASGLQYTVMAAGDAKAASPTATDRVIVEYRSRLLDGTLFDSSSAHGGKVPVNLNGGAIKGWKEALQLMKPGAQWRLFVPPELAYDASPPPGIPPGALLVYDLTLVGLDQQVRVITSQPGAEPAKTPPKQ